MSGAILIRGGTVIDARGTRTRDVGVNDGLIIDPESLPATKKVIDASGCFVTTGLVDLHAHLGEPGDEAAETMDSAGRAAVLGGYTTVLAMPNTFPPVDTAAVVQHVRALSASALCRVEVAGTVTVAGAGERLAPLGELAAAGVRFVTDCGAGIQNPLMLRRALEYARPLGLVIAQPAYCVELARDAQMHEGEWSSRLGLPGMPAEAEEIMVMRDISITRLAQGRLHFQTLSTAGAFAIIGAARRSGAQITAEVTAHHLALTDADLAEYDTNKKVDPPLRHRTDVDAALAAVADGRIDAIVTDHTPRPSNVKEQPFDQADAGTVGLETTLAVVLSSGTDPMSALRALSWRPAELLGLGAPSRRGVEPGHTADIAVIDPERPLLAAVAAMATMGSNSAFEGRELKGRVRATIVGGRLVVDEYGVAA